MSDGQDLSEAFVDVVPQTHWFPGRLIAMTHWLPQTSHGHSVGAAS